MMNLTKILATLVICTLIAGNAMGGVIYQQNFDNATGDGQPLAGYGWYGYTGSSSSDTSTDMSKGYVSGAEGASGTTGFVYFPATAYQPWHAWTEQDFGSYADLDQVIVQSRSGSPGGSALDQAKGALRVAIRFGTSSWFFSHDTLDDPDSANWSELTFDFDGASWENFDGAPGGLSGEGNINNGLQTATLPDSNVTAIGFWVSKDTTTVRWDDFVVTAVPEPATMGLLAVGGLALVRRKRR